MKEVYLLLDYFYISKYAKKAGLGVKISEELNSIYIF